MKNKKEKQIKKYIISLEKMETEILRDIKDGRDVNATAHSVNVPINILLEWLSFKKVLDIYQKVEDYRISKDKEFIIKSIITIGDDIQVHIETINKEL